MSEDPKGFDAGDYNLFRYCGNDPEDRTDPMGLQGEANGNEQRLQLPTQANPAISKNLRYLRNMQRLINAKYLAGLSVTAASATLSAMQPIADVANSKVGSKAYLVNTAKGNYGVGSDKCNELVADVIEESGRPRPRVHYTDTGLLGWLKSLFTRDPDAHEWATGRVSGWSGPKPVSEAQAGDVIAQAHGPI